MNKPAKAIDLLENDRRVLQNWVRAHTTPQQIARRGMIILRASEGMANSRIAEEAGVSRTTVVEWRKRFVKPKFPPILALTYSYGPVTILAT